jgi:hypothetical protein
MCKTRGAFPVRVKLHLIDKAYQFQFIATNLINAEPVDGFE